jgi:hypothetical protein
MENGFPKVRKLFTRSWSEAEVTWIVAAKDVPAVQSFFELDCQAGATPFRIEDPLTKRSRLVRWAEAPTVSVTVERRPTASVSGRLEVIG